jgi:hypothetical protein
MPDENRVQGELRRNQLPGWRRPVFLELVLSAGDGCRNISGLAACKKSLVTLACIDSEFDRAGDMKEKKTWQEPLVRSIDQLGTVLGLECKTGTSATGTGTKQCNGGRGASSGYCNGGSGAQLSCSGGTAR